MNQLNQNPSQRSIYIWNITGSIANALLSIVALMIVTRFLDDRQADIFSIAWSISLLMATVGTFQIRMYQATDVKGVFCFRQYHLFRIITVCVMMVSSYIYILMRGYTGKKALVVMVICLFRAVDSMADVYEGWFQQKERLDLAGKALTYRIIVAVIGFGIGLALTKDLLFSCLILVASYMICYVLYDLRYYKAVDAFRSNVTEGMKGAWIVKMVMEGFPLFINAFLIASIMNAPKMVLDTVIEQGMLEQGVQTAFNIIFMPASFLNLAYIVFRPLITKMAVMWNVGEEKEFLKILIKVEIALIGIGIVILAGSALIGIPALSFVYAVELAEYKRELLVVIIGGCIYTFAAVLDNALVVIRMQYVLVLSYVVTYLYIKIAAKVMIGSWGVLGGAISYATAMGVFFVVTAVMFAVCFYHVYRKRL
ncbi:MAG: lipopolysaccharide biosynthesis protein [Dorea sp.]|jgi:O-antigen/teichoic acid export membrane protein|nr:lipopolysaccharide biosynthesis protein [Dorea sp.]